MAFTGDLQGMSLADVFQNIAGNRNTGVLHIQWPRGERYVRFTEGRVSGLSHGIGRGLPLLPYLLERGTVSPAGADQVRQRLKKSRRSPGRLLQDLHLLDTAGLTDAVRDLVSDNVFDLVALKEAKFTFTVGDGPERLFDIDQRDANLSLDVGPLLLEGARRIDEWARIRAVIGNDTELFIATADPAELADADAAAVLSHLDGRIDLPALGQATGLCRFDVAAILAVLVQDGSARPVSADEIVALSRATVDQGEATTAVRLLRAGLERRPRDPILRQQLAEVLADSDAVAAATEFAVLAFQATEEDHLQDALGFYERAIALHPADVMLHQRRCELLARLGDTAGLNSATLDFADRLCTVGLLDRARALLTEHVDGGPLRGSPELLRRLANLCGELGDQPAAAHRWLQLAALHGAADEPERQLECLRAALYATPDDESLQQRVADLESGRAARARQRLKLVLWLSAAAVLLLTAALIGTGEMLQARALAQALSHAGSDADAVATQDELAATAGRWSWLPSSRTASELAGRQAEHLLQLADQRRQQGEFAAAGTLLAAARTALPTAAAGRAAALATRLAVEAPLYGFLRHVEARGSDDGEACEALARATTPEQQPFLLEQLPLVRCDAARQALLRALEGRPGPGIAKAVLAALLAAHEPVTVTQCERLLQATMPQLLASEKRALAAQLQAAQQHPELRARATHALAMFDAPAPTPR